MTTKYREIQQTLNRFYLPEPKPMSQIIAMDRQARSGFGLYRNGKQIAYHLSIDMNVKVNTDTVTDTVCKRNGRTVW